MAVAVGVATHILLLLQCLDTVRAPPILLYRHYSPDQLISRTRGPITRDLSVHGDPNVNPNCIAETVAKLFPLPNVS